MAELGIKPKPTWFVSPRLHPLPSYVQGTKLEVLEDTTRCDVDLLDLLKPGGQHFHANGKEG